ncbi:MAG TPA: T9SS type A sorting domain-containing protein [Chitinophagaceae bacterium]
MQRNQLSQYLLKAACLWLLYLLLPFYSSSQVTTISGIINSYYQVTAVVPSKACVTVSNPAGLAPLTKVLIVQMKGATVNTNDNSNYGDTTSLNNAGNYEINYICYVKNDSAFLVYNLLNSYTATDKVQLVPFARYQNATVTDTIKAKRWDNTSGTGGVIAIDVVDNLTLNAPIYADSSGFRGGLFFQSGNFCTNSINGYVYNASASTQYGAYKGEGVYDITSATVNGGRGAPANAGGGGNNHNNSGGGGANLNAGGLAGGNSSNTSSGCYATFKGMAGKALSNWGGKKIFSGGGGGAGHNNGGFKTSAGGSGGGIVVIQAETLIANGNKVSASGGKGDNSLSDGAGGGGAGGTIIMDVATYTGSAVIQANGGNGGASDDGGNLNKCFGGGGGGSGGVIYFTSITPGITIYDTAGTKGPEVGRHDPSCSTPQPAADGINGQIISNYTYRIANVFASTCGIPLPVSLVSFKAIQQEKKVQLAWRIANPESVKDFVVEKKNAGQLWQPIATIPANDGQENYFSVDLSPFKGDNFYRLKITEKNNSVSYSAIRHLYFSMYENGFSLYPNPATNKITIRINDPGTTQLMLMDISGKLIFKKVIRTANSEITLPSLSKGIYMVRINGSSQKLVVR